MLNLKKITTTVSLLSLGALSVALFSAGCDSGTSSNGTGGAGGAGGEANIMYQVALNGAMEGATTGLPISTGTGSATVVLNPSTGAVTVTGSFTGLSSQASGAHIHGSAAAGAAAGVIVPLTASPATAGAISGSGTLTSQQIMDMKNGLTYINVHSMNYSAGEIRGQIQ